MAMTTISLTASTNASAKALTQREAFTTLLALDAVQADARLVEFLTHRLALLDKPRAVSGKLTKAQKDAMEMRERIFAILINLPAGEGMTSSAISDMIGETTSKVSGHLTQLAKEGRAIRTVVKRRGVWTACPSDAE